MKRMLLLMVIAAALPAAAQSPQVLQGDQITESALVE